MRLDALNRFTPYALAILRIVAGLIFIPHGMQKLFGFPEPPKTGSRPHSRCSGSAEF
jgi:putative oxidoreductase